MALYRVMHHTREMTNRPGVSRKDAVAVFEMLAQTQSNIRIEVYDAKKGEWKYYAPPARRNKSGGRVTYTVATVDPYTQRSTSRLGRRVSKREAMKIAAMWERHGATNVCVIDSNGRIHYQSSGLPANRNRSGAQGRLVRFMPMATQWEQYSGWEGHAFADPSNDGYYHITWRHHREGMPTYVHAQHLSFKIRKLSKRFAAA